MARDDYLDHLANIELFSGLDRGDLRSIARASDEVNVEQGRVLMAEGAPGHEAYVVIEGTAVVERNGQQVAETGPGAHFGELALLDGGVRTATVTARTPMRLLVLGQREFVGVLEEVPGLANRIMATLAGQVRSLDDRRYG